VAYALVEFLGEDRIAVMDEATVGTIRWDRVAQLLQGPWCRGVRRHIGVQDAAGGVSITTNTYRRRNVAVTTTQKSQATIAWV
jgi:hypothetical protein